MNSPSATAAQGSVHYLPTFGQQLPRIKRDRRRKLPANVVDFFAARTDRAVKRLQSESEAALALLSRFAGDDATTQRMREHSKKIREQRDSNASQRGAPWSR